ncbi:MAG: hypothetical protein F6K19_01540 [Cyanothece sp. SIO1E1]|nr:hypothetical protein [Cyanothece sp. SIO1E1]
MKKTIYTLIIQSKYGNDTENSFNEHDFFEHYLDFANEHDINEDGFYSLEEWKGLREDEKESYFSSLQTLVDEYNIEGSFTSDDLLLYENEIEIPEPTIYTVRNQYGDQTVLSSYNEDDTKVILECAEFGDPDKTYQQLQQNGIKYVNDIELYTDNAFKEDY